MPVAAAALVSVLAGTAVALSNDRPAPVTARGPRPGRPTAAAPSSRGPAVEPGVSAVPVPVLAPPRSAPPAPAAVLAGVETLTWAGVPRRAVTARPPAQQGPLPLVLVLHGRASNPHGEQRRTHLDELAARGEALVVYPEALGPSWNAGRCCDGAATDDSGFLAALTARLVAQQAADPHRVYAVGFSTGAMMAYRFACDRPDLLAGIGSVGGVLVSGCPVSLRVPLVDVHSRQDPLVPLRGTTRSALSGIPLPGVGDVVDTWRRRTGCGGRLYAAEVARDGAAELRDVSGCPPGGAVRLLLTMQRGHVWPQAGDGLDASVVLWTFLREQRHA